MKICDFPDYNRADRERSRIQKGMTLAAVFEQLAPLCIGPTWNGLVAGFGCNFGGEKRAWILHRHGSRYSVVTHLEDTPSARQGDWKQTLLVDAAAVRRFLGQRATGTCSGYRTNFGWWAFNCSLRDQQVRQVDSLESNADR